jgi:hypothetical protein
LSDLDGVPIKVTKPNKVAETSIEQPEGIDLNAHDLSEDNLPEEVKSVAEEAEEIQFPIINVPNAGNDAEQFLDATMSTVEAKPIPQQRSGASYMGSPVKAARKSFNPQAPGVRVAEYTGDESEIL